jgi:hyperosmotically inducible protein
MVSSAHRLLLLPFPAILAGCSFLMPNPYTTPVSVAVSVTEIAVEDRTMDEMTDDLKVKAAILQTFASQAKGLLVDVSADVYQGSVLLTGAVKTAEDDQKAEAIARKVEGVKVVYNEIMITDEMDMRTRLRDSRIELKVKFAVMAAAGVRYPNYRWRAINGRVYLFGTAQTDEELDAVYDKVRGLDEVERLTVHLKIRPQAPLQAKPDQPKQEPAPISTSTPKPPSRQ